MKDSVFRILVIVLLTFNTFFIGSIWCAIKCGSCGFSKASICPFSAKKGSGKICPITGKPLQGADGSVQGSPKGSLAQ